MKKISFAVAAATTFSALALGLAGTAGAAPTGGGVTDALPVCGTTGVHGVPVAGSRSFTTVYVDVSCPDVR